MGNVWRQAFGGRKDNSPGDGEKKRGWTTTSGPSEVAWPQQWRGHRRRQKKFDWRTMIAASTGERRVLAHFRHHDLRIRGGIKSSIGVRSYLRPD